MASPRFYGPLRGLFILVFSPLLSIGVALIIVCWGFGDSLERIYTGMFAAVLMQCLLLAAGLTYKEKFSSLRSVLSISHHWMGSMLGAMLFVICLSGSLTVLEPELSSWEMSTSSLAKYRGVKLDDLFSQARIAFPSATVLEIDIPESQEPWKIKSVGNSAAGSKTPIFIFPPKQRVYGDLTGILHRLHTSFFSGFFGRIFVSLFGFVLGALVMGGVVMHPRRKGSLLSLKWNKRFRLRTLAYDLHKLFGLWFSPLLLLIAITGIFPGVGSLAAKQLATLAFVESPIKIEKMLPRPYQRPEIHRVAPMMSLDQLLYHHAKAHPNFRVRKILIHYWGDENAYVTLKGTRPWQLSTVKYENYHYALTNLRLLSHDSASDYGIFVRGFIATKSLHFARYAGALSRGLHTLAGLAASILAASGVWLWLKRHEQERVASYARPWLSGITIGLVLALSVLFAVTAITTNSWPMRSDYQSWAFGCTWMGAQCACFLPRQQNMRLSLFLLRLAAVIFLLAAIINVVSHRQNPTILSINLILLLATATLWGLAHKLKQSP